MTYFHFCYRYYYCSHILFYFYIVIYSVVRVRFNYIIQSSLNSSPAKKTAFFFIKFCFIIIKIQECFFFFREELLYYFLELYHGKWMFSLCEALLYYHFKINWLKCSFYFYNRKYQLLRLVSVFYRKQFIAFHSYLCCNLFISFFWTIAFQRSGWISVDSYCIKFK